MSPLHAPYCALKGQTPSAVGFALGNAHTTKLAMAGQEHNIDFGSCRWGEYRFKKGRAEGEAIGLQKGRVECETIGVLKTAKKMKEEGLDVNVISKLFKFF